MAVLAKESSDGEHEVYLYAEHTVGRSPTCKLVLPRKNVSSFHACLSWHGEAWVMRDLGSRNGTYVNGQRVREQPHPLRLNDRIVFGDQDETWVLIDDFPPRALLVPVHNQDDDGRVGQGSQSLILDDLRAFPSDENPQTTIFQDADGRFFLEAQNGDSKELSAQQHVSIGDVTYRVHLPGAVDGVFTTHTTAGRVVESSVRTMRLTLNVAPDEETAAAVIDAGAVQAELKPRVHLYLLLHLARLRVDESRADSAKTDSARTDSAGWISVEVLCDDLQITPEQLGLQVFRIRDDMKKIGLSDAGEIIDRRRRGWIRIGVPAGQISLGRM